MKKDEDEDENLAGIALGLGSLHNHFLGTDVEGKVTRSSIF